MRRFWVYVIGNMSVLMMGASIATAQQPYWEQLPGARNVSRSPTLDPFRPYGSTAANQDARSGSRYSSAPRPVRPQAVRVNHYAQRREYFPGLRSGQGPNASLAHCVPSRTQTLSVNGHLSGTISRGVSGR